jgi:hypothetical protein
MEDDMGEPMTETLDVETDWCRALARVPWFWFTAIDPAPTPLPATPPGGV